MAKKLILINPKFCEETTVFSLPISILHLGSWVKSQGYDVSILDALHYKNDADFCQNCLEGKLCDDLLIGVSVMSAQIPSALAISKYIRTNSKATIIWGGVHPTLYPEQTAENPLIDYVISGHGEKPIISLLNNDENINGKVIDARLFKEENLNNLPMIDFDLVQSIVPNMTLREITNKSLYGYPILSGRGCPHKCIEKNELISMADGTLRSISQIKENDKILSVDMAGKIKVGNVRKVVETSKNRKIISIKTTGKKLLCTFDHLILTPKGWIEAGKLKERDHVATSSTHRCRKTKNKRVIFDILEKSRGCQKTERDRCKNFFTKEWNTCNCGSCRKQSKSAVKEFCCNRKIKIANAAEQSNEKSRSSKKSQQYYNKEILDNVVRKGKEAAFRGNNSCTYFYEGRSREDSSENDIKQSYERSLNSNEAIRDTEKDNTEKYYRIFEKVESKSYWSKWPRNNSREDSKSNGVQVCGRFPVLDRSLSEWKMQKSRFYFGEWEEQNSSTLRWEILASISRNRRCRNNGLQDDGMADICGNRSYAGGCDGISEENFGMVGFEKVVSIEDAGCSSVWDIEAYPYHNFIASGIVVHNCSFCINSITSEKYITRNTDSIISFIEEITTKYGIKRIWFVDEDFFGNKRRAEEFIDKVIEKKLSFEWVPSVRVDYFRDNYLGGKGYLAKLRKAGCIMVGTGAESGSQCILDKVNKEVLVEDTINMAHKVHEAGLIANFSFMIGLPDETIDDYKATLKLIEQIIDIDPKFYIFGPQIYRPYPGSELFYECITKGLEEPKSLIAWANSPYIHSEFASKNYFSKKLYPWVNYNKDLTSLVFYTTLMGMKPESKLVTAILRFIGKWRCKLFWFDLPIEKKLYGWIRGSKFEKVFRK